MIPKREFEGEAQYILGDTVPYSSFNIALAFQNWNPYYRASFVQSMTNLLLPYIVSNVTRYMRTKVKNIFLKIIRHDTVFYNDDLRII